VRFLLPATGGVGSESIAMMELGVHLPLMEINNEGLSLRRLQAVVAAIRGWPY
jgi:hypothetical protein